MPKPLKRHVEHQAGSESRGIELVSRPITGSDAVRQPGCDIEQIDAEQFSTDVDLVVVLGGDGTMIAAARLIGDHDVPVLGVNYGSLGYLTDFRIEEMFPTLETVLAGEFEIDRRVMLRAEHWRDGSASSARSVVVGRNITLVCAVIRVESSYITLGDSTWKP